MIATSADDFETVVKIETSVFGAMVNGHCERGRSWTLYSRMATAMIQTELNSSARISQPHH